MEAIVLYLIEYDRPKGSIVELLEFKDSERSAAEEKRLQIELELNRNGLEHELALLEALSKNALYKTHSRYFRNLSEIIQHPKARS
jgi:hypothetical protein